MILDTRARFHAAANIDTEGTDLLNRRCHVVHLEPA